MYNKGMDELLKRCTKCKQEKLLQEFAGKTRTKDGLDYWCRQCNRVSRQNYYFSESGKEYWSQYKARPEYKEDQRRWHRQHREQNLPKYLWKAARKRAQQKCLPFTITVDDIIIPEACPILEIPIAASLIKISDSSPTLDRIDNDLGYVPGNIQVISYLANSMKRNASIKQLKSFASWITETFGVD
jgi:hypothetical protein